MHTDKQAVGVFVIGINDAGDKFVQSGCDLNEFAYGLFDILHEEAVGVLGRGE